MSTIQERARDAQIKALGAHGGNDALLQATKDLYDKVDALSLEQKTLLVREALVKASGLLEAIKDAPSREVRNAYGALGHAVLAVAGYAIEDYRENLDFNVTGDRRVDAVIDGVKDLLHQFAASTMSEEENALADTIRDAVAARVEAGEDFETVMAEEIKKHGDAIKAVESHKVEETPSRYSGDGLYL